MFNSRKKRALMDVETEEPRYSVSEQYANYSYLNATSKENEEELKQVEEEENTEGLPLGLNLDFKEENIVQAVIYSEIFGKPKSKRRKR